MKICPACRGGCQCTPGTSTTSVPFSKGGRDHRQKKCLSAHWHVGACGQLGDRALVQNQALQPCGRQGHQSVTWSRYLQIHWCDILRNKCPSESSLCFVSIQGEKNVSDDILTCSKESCSPERGDIPPETTLWTEGGPISDLKKKSCNSTPLALSVPAKIWGKNNIWFYQISVWPSRYHTTQCLYLSDPEKLLQHVIVHQNEGGNGLPGHADSPDAENPAFCVNGSCKR